MFFVCFCSGLSLLSSAAFQFIGKRRRTRASRKLPTTKYRRNLQRTLLHQLVEEQNVIDRITFDESGEEDYAEEVVLGAMDDSVVSGADCCGDDEMCSICLDEFQVGSNVKVLPCQHFYHVACIDPWLERQSSRCPLCKQDAISTGEIPQLARSSECMAWC